MKKQFFFSLLLIFALSGCTAISDIEPEILTRPVPLPTTDNEFIIPALPTDEPEKPVTQKTRPPLLPSDSNLENLTDKAKEDLAQRLEIPVDNITVVAVIGQEFSAEAFNCRNSKERVSKEEALQVISGQSILLRASGRRYEYHASGQTLIFCRPLP